jgi:monoamine oxidase
MKHFIVIGAGAAGLMTGYVLSEAGHQVTILEARTYAGGRIQPRTNAGSVFQAGAEFVHGELSLTDLLIKESGAAKRELKGSYYQFRDGRLKEDDEFGINWHKLTKALNELQEDMSLSEFMQRHFFGDEYTALRENVRRFVEGYDAADIHKISAKAIQREWNSGDADIQYHINGGYGKLVDHLCGRIIQAGGKIQCNSVVKTIEHVADEVTVITESGKVVRGNKSIVTIPLGLLHRERILFSPPIPEYMSAFRKIGFGGVVKIMIEFREAFWQNDQKFKNLGFIFSDASIPTWWTQLPDERPLLTGWLGGPQANDAVKSKQDLLQLGIDSLAYIFSCSATDIKEKIKTSIVADWISDPYAGGAYAYATVETAAARQILSRPVNNTLFFAGEALYNGSAMGTVEAALSSGKEVAYKVLAGL